MTVRFGEERRATAPAQSHGDERPRARDETSGHEASGSAGGAYGQRLRIPRLAYAGVAVFVLALTTVNALSVLHDTGPEIAAWKPFVWEYSSAVMSIAVLPLMGWMAARERFLRGRRSRAVAAHFLATIVYCLVHVGGFVMLRKLVYAGFGQHYAFGSVRELVYEYRKDALGYCAVVAVFVLTARLGTRPEPAAGEPEATPTFDIREGARLIRAPVSDILSAHSAGNYVEFHLADGRRPLMRVTLSSVEAALAPRGFVRTHRSWLVNPQRLRALEPEGSGDWRIQLDGGAQAPLSRRFPLALEALRRP